MSITRDEIRRRAEAALVWGEHPVLSRTLQAKVLGRAYLLRESGPCVALIQGSTTTRHGCEADAITAAIDAAVNHFVEVLEFFGVEVGNGN